MTGDELTEMIEEDFQWIWGVLSAFPKDISKEKVMKYKLPEADGNGEIWQNPVSIQHPLAEIEIIAWDSSATVFISKEDSIVDLLQKNNEYPCSKNIGDELTEPIESLDTHDIVLCEKREDIIEKMEGSFEYKLQGELKDIQNGIVDVYGFFIHIDEKRIPGDITNGMYIQFIVSRLDIW